MRLDYPAYQTLVLELCKQKRKDPASSSLLISATPANLREECISVYKARGQKVAKGDEKILKDFYGPPTPRKDLNTLIETCHPDRFKPLQNLINGKTKSPDVIIVELLAWLIDFRHRPYTYDMDVELSKEERAILKKPADNRKEDHPISIESISSDIEDEPEAILNKEEENFANPLKLISTEKKPKRKRVMVTGILVLAALLLVGYIIWQEQRVREMALLNGNSGCMYWTGDHYEETPCNEDRKDRFKFPIDFEKMKRFKKITQIDTITEKSIGKIYYIRINGGIEYYTDGGNHPVEITRKLQPLSAYMFAKHLAKDGVASKER